MNWAWPSSLDQIWNSPTFPVWLTLAAAGFFGIIVLIALLRAEKSVANGALTVMTLLAVGVAAAATFRGSGPDGQTASAESRSTSPPVTAALPQLACIDDLAGDTVLNACEKTLFGSAESAAAAVAYAGSQITRLTSFGDAASADRKTSPELQTLRRAVERDRYGLMAYVMMARDHCRPASCATFRSLADSRQVAANMEERVYENLITRYAALWNAPPPAPAGVGLLAGLPPSVPTGKPTNAEFPSASSTPPVNIMTPEPGPAPAAAKPPAAAVATPAPAPRPATAISPAVAAAKKQPAAPKRAAAAPAPVQIAPAPATAAAPAASNE
jgi:hypothetical protein